MASGTLIIEQGAFPGPVGINPKGVWNSTTTYLTRDLVFFNRSSWLSLKLNSNIVPSSLRPDVWMLLAEGALSDSNLVFRDTWSSLIDYYKNDVVLFGNSSYVAVLPNINKKPDIETVYWHLLAVGASPDDNRDDTIDGGKF